MWVSLRIPPNKIILDRGFNFQELERKKTLQEEFIAGIFLIKNCDG